MSTDPVISVQNVSKAYRIWGSPADRLTTPLLAAAAQMLPAALGLQARAAKNYRDFWALKDISFEVRKGEAVGIIGRNGSGKSTLLQIIAGTLQPTEGKAQVKGRVAALLELGSGFNPQFTGRENVYLSGAVLGLPRSEIDARFDSIAAFADIGDFIEQPVNTYSSGMAARLAFAVVAHVDADILIIDEALAVGDVFFVQKCLRWLRAFRDRGTLLFVTHNAADLNSMCHRAVWLRDGQAEMIGEALRVSEAYLEYFHYETSGVGKNTAPKAPAPAPAPAAAAAPVETVDQRLPWLNATQFRNDIKPLLFDPDQPSFGERQAEIVQVEFVTRDEGKRLSWIVGGEPVTLRIVARAGCALTDPILGFYIKDRLGQQLFGDNTYLSNVGRSLVVPAGGLITAEFTFRMPLLHRGRYVVSVAVATGTQAQHVQQHWIHEALVFESANEIQHRGLVAIPMERIETTIRPA